MRYMGAQVHVRVVLCIIIRKGPSDILSIKWRTFLYTSRVCEKSFETGCTSKNGKQSRKTKKNADLEKAKAEKGKRIDLGNSGGENHGQVID